MPAVDEHEVLGDAEVGHDAVAHALLWDMREPRRAHLGRRGTEHLLAVYEDRAALGRTDAGDGLRQLSLAVA